MRRFVLSLGLWTVLCLIVAPVFWALLIALDHSVSWLEPVLRTDIAQLIFSYAGPLALNLLLAWRMRLLDRSHDMPSRIGVVIAAAVLPVVDWGLAAEIAIHSGL